MKIFVIIPVKSLAEGKSRLSGVLSDTERRNLNQDFLRRTLAVTAEIPGAAHTIVVSADSDVLAAAAAHGAGPVPEPAGGGLNAALHAGRAHALSLGAEGVLVVPVDLPLLSAADIAALIASPGDRPCARIAPDERGAGTNALFLAPCDGMDFHFGPDSFTAHIEAARDAGLASSIVHVGRVSFDVDTPEDYARYAAMGD
ncbi:MAG: 2-phospho-L-lactate guanylyltransferase [Alphaproteobacteria bacterium]